MKYAVFSVSRIIRFCPVAGIAFALVLQGCSGGWNGHSAQGVQSSQPSSASESVSQAGPGATKSALTPPTCTTSDLAGFAKTDGLPLDLEKESLPKGVLLASSAELLIERSADSTMGENATRVAIFEATAGKSAEIRCIENLPGLGSDFDMTMTAPVKFELAKTKDGLQADAAAVYRQFFFFLNKQGYGVVSSNPRVLRSGDLATPSRLFDDGASHMQVYRVGEKNFLLRSVRERDGRVKATLQIHFDLI